MLDHSLDRAAMHFFDLAKDGPDLTEKAHLKAAHEAVEFSDEPSLEELADTIICLVVAAYKRDWTIADIAQAVDDKMIVNKLRVWDQQPDGTWQHKVSEEI